MAKHEKENEEREDRKCGGPVGHKGHKGLKRGGSAKIPGGAAKPEKADGNPYVLKEAGSSKHNIGKIGGVAGKARLDRKCGGKVRANGGGADSNPYSSAGKALRQNSGN
jgi:hypothetical protein